MQVARSSLGTPLAAAANAAVETRAVNSFIRAESVQDDPPKSFTRSRQTSPAHSPPDPITGAVPPPLDLATDCLRPRIRFHRPP